MSRQSLAADLKGSLPRDFHHGYASAAYQIEGGFDEGGRGLSVWEPALEGMDNGDIACDSFNRWEEDVALLKQYGSNSYRFSISWSRLIPLGEFQERCICSCLGGREDSINEEGVQYYSALVSQVHRIELIW
jgi:beta-glucosidase